MNKIQKLLLKLDEKERRVVREVVSRILARDLTGLDVKKLRGMRNVYRVRKGDLRIIFSIERDMVNIISIGRRNDTTYNL